VARPRDNLASALLSNLADFIGEQPHDDEPVVSTCGMDAAARNRARQARMAAEARKAEASRARIAARKSRQ
jgi:hypothetical protein